MKTILCDICMKPINASSNSYSLVHKVHTIFDVKVETELDICEDCLARIRNEAARGDEKRNESNNEE